jgi:hypothetical protein
MRRRGEIGARPVAIRALAKLALVKLRTPAVEIPALLLEMARGASSREITRQWGANPEIMRKFLAQFRRDLDADPTAPAALTIVLADQVPEILRQRARGASVTDLARQWRINLKAMSRFLLR